MTVRPGAYLRWLARDSRGARGRLVFFTACLGVGVAAVVAVAGLSSSLDAGIRDRARELLAADLAVTSRRAPPPELDGLLTEIGAAARADVRELVTVVAAPARGGEPGPSRLVELKAVAPGYPFYGTVAADWAAGTTNASSAPPAPADPAAAPQPAGPAEAAIPTAAPAGTPAAGGLAGRLGARGALAAPELLAALGLGPGDVLLVGGEPFTIAGTLRSEPDRLSVGLAFGPRLFVALEGLERTALVQKGSRVDHRVLVALPLAAGAAELAAAVERLREALGPGYRVESWRQAQPEVRRGIEQVDRYLGLVALLSLLIGGVGVAQTVRAWVAGRLDAVAALKCLGMRPREVLALYLGQTALLALAGSVAGAAAGIVLLATVPRWFADLVPAALVDPWQPAALLRGLALGLAAALLFSLPPLLAVLRVPALRVLRRDAEPPPPPRAVTAALAAGLAGGVFAMAALQAGSALRGLEFTAALAVSAAALAGAALALSRAAARLPRAGGGLGWRFALAALARPGAGTVGAVVALGLGVLVVVAMALVERQLGAELSAELPEDAPTVFLIDVQPGQWPGVQEELEAAGALEIDSVPVVMARLAAIDGRAVGELVAERGEAKGEARWALTREQRLTYLDELPADNRIVAGALWDLPDRPEVSVEEEFARDLGVGVGSRITFDVQGVPLELWVSSLRAVDWRSFGINFFLVVEPGVLDGAPQQRVAAALLPPGREQGLQDRLAAAYPNVTVLRLREILDKIAAVLRRIGQAVRLLGGFTVAAGAAILAGTAAAGAARRGREAALLKTLGLTRAGVAGLFAAEHAAVGALAGLLGAAGGAAVSWLVLTRWMDLGASARPLVLVTAFAGAALLSAAAGLAASTRALTRPPVEALRADG